MNDFAKTYRHETLGQILVLRTTNDQGGPAIAFFCEPGLAYCIKSSFPDNDAGWDARNLAFADMTIEKAIADFTAYIPTAFSPVQS